MNKQGPGAVGHHTSVVYGPDMYLFGGSNSRTENKGFYKLNCLTNTWELIQKVKSGSELSSRDGHSACMASKTGKMYIFGGFIGGVNSNSLVAYDFAKQTWSRVDT